jgi:hypothetical protein
MPAHSLTTIPKPGTSEPCRYCFQSRKTSANNPGDIVMKICILIVSIFIPALLACSLTPQYVDELKRKGTIRVDYPDDKSYDYKVTIPNLVDPPVWNGGSREDRQKTVELLFADRCKKVSVLDETVLNQGSYGLRERISYVMKVACDR